MADSFRRDSYRNPHGIPSDSGYGYGKGKTEESLRETGSASRRPVGIRDDSVRRTEAERRSSETFRRTWQWAEEHVPERATAFAATAYEMLDWRHRKYGGIEPTPENVRARLDALYGERSFKRFYPEAK